MRSSPTYWPASHSSSSPTSTSAISSTLVDAPAYYPDGPVSPAQLPALVAAKLTQQVIDYLVERVCDAVDFGLGRPSSSTSLLSKRSRTHSRRWQSSERAAFTEFCATVLRRAEVTLPAVIGALVYIDRSRPHLSIAIEEWAPHRVFLGSLITASKYLNDASLKNAHWAMCTGVFGRRDVQRIEREFLEVLDWELAVTEADLIRVCTRMVRAGALVRPVVKSVEPAVMRKEMHMEVDGLAEKNREVGSLQAAQALWQLRPHNRPEKRAQADVDMDVDEFAAERARRRRSSYASPASSETCSTCTVNSSPDTDSDDSNSPRTPPSPHSAPRGHYAVPGSTEKPIALPMHAKSVSNGSMSFQPFALLDAFPAVPAPPALGPTPSIAISPAFVPGSVQMPAVPPPLPSLPPYAAFPLTRAFPGSHPHLTQRPHSSRPASPYAKVLLPPGQGSGSRSRPVTPYSHRRSSAISTAPSLYPAYMPTVTV